MGTGASLYRRGTHVLLMEGFPRFFLESRTIDLNQYEGKTAVVQGELFLNTHPTFLPVLQVSVVSPQEREASQGALQRYDVPALGLSFEAPGGWKSELAEERLMFRTVSGGVEPFLTVQKASENELPAGLPLRVGGHNAVRVMDEGAGKHHVYVHAPAKGTILFTFVPPEPSGALQLRDAFYSMLRSVRFEEDEGEEQDSALSDSEDAPDGPVIPCGGPAHVLCPEDMFCEVRELDTGIGVCRKL